MRRFSILVVDDDPDIVMILKDNLSLDGYRVTTASTGREAMDLFQPDGFDLVLLDLMLPDFDGVQVCRSLRDKASMPLFCLPPKIGCPTKSWVGERGPMTMWSSPSIIWNWPPGYGLCCAEAMPIILLPAPRWRVVSASSRNPER